MESISTTCTRILDEYVPLPFASFSMENSLELEKYLPRRTRETSAGVINSPGEQGKSCSSNVWNFLPLQLLKCIRSKKITIFQYIQYMVLY